MSPLPEPHHALLAARWQSVSTMPSTPFQSTMMNTGIVFTVLALIVYCLRMYSRIRTKQMGLDDCLMTVAMVMSIADVVAEFMFFRYTYIGFAPEDIPADRDTTPGLFWEYLMEVFYNPILALVKSSVLLFLLRISGHNKGVRWTIYIVNAINIGEMVALFLVCVFQVTPIESMWDENIKPTAAIDIVAFIIATSAITIATDIIVLAIPFVIFIGLQMRLAQKLSLLVVFLAGGIVTAVSILRLVTIEKSMSDPTFIYTNSWGPALSMIETNLAIITACVPALRPLFVIWLPRWFRNKSSGEGGAYPTSGFDGTTRKTLGTRKTTGPRSTSQAFEMESRGGIHTEIRGHSPTGSEEEIMTYNGIIRTTNVNVSYDVRSVDTAAKSEQHFVEYEIQENKGFKG